MIQTVTLMISKMHRGETAGRIRHCGSHLPLSARCNTHISDKYLCFEERRYQESAAPKLRYETEEGITLHDQPDMNDQRMFWSIHRWTRCTKTPMYF